MAKPVFKHQDDDGDLSIFASGSVVVLACEHGHYWVLETKEHSRAEVGPALEDMLRADQAKALLTKL